MTKHITTIQSLYDENNELKSEPSIEQENRTLLEVVNHPSHYNSHPSGVECIDVVEHLCFNIGNAMKYLWRCDHKGNAIEQLEKAKWYIQREIELRKKKI